jgi:hypothetical protein
MYTYRFVFSKLKPRRNYKNEKPLFIVLSSTKILRKIIAKICNSLVNFSIVCKCLTAGSIFKYCLMQQESSFLCFLGFLLNQYSCGATDTSQHWSLKFYVSKLAERQRLHFSFKLMLEIVFVCQQFPRTDHWADIYTEKQYLPQ